MKAHGYVSLVRSGKYEEAFRLHMEDAPLPGSLSRACYAPCEDECTRGEVEGKVPVRAIKRFMVDRYYEHHPEPEYGPPENRNGKKVAIVGSGPAGLSTAYFLARKGYLVTIFEAGPEAGGMLRHGIPPFRLPREVVDRDIRNITALGVDLRTRSPVTSLASLKAQGFDATFLALGTMEGHEMGIPGTDLPGVYESMDFLKAGNAGNMLDVEGKRVAVIGGGNVAIDSARVALRMGAEKVTIFYRRRRAEMPAHDWEVQAALDEGIELKELSAPVRFHGEGGRLNAAEWITMKLGEPDASGRRRPVPVKGSEKTFPADVVVLAVGLRPSTRPFAAELERNADETIKADPETLATSVPSVFAGGDDVTGPSMIIEAIAQGKRAAFYIERTLEGKSLSGITFDARLPAVEQKAVLDRAKVGPSRRTPSEVRERHARERLRSMDEIELPLTEEEARYSANRCLDCGVCSECLQCVKACPADAIRFDMLPEEKTVEAGSVLVSTGFQLFDAGRKPELRLRTVPECDHSHADGPHPVPHPALQRRRAPVGRYGACQHRLRPLHRLPRLHRRATACARASAACTRSNRPSSSWGRCLWPTSRSTTSTSGPSAKGYDEFYEQAKGMGVRFVKGRVANIEERQNDNLVVQYEDISVDGQPRRAEHDLVVLSVGLSANPEAFRLFQGDLLAADPYAYVREIDEDLEPGKTSIDGVFVAGTASAIRDIPDTILHSGAAAVQVAAYLEGRRAGR